MVLKTGTLGEMIPRLFVWLTLPVFLLAGCAAPEPLDKSQDPKSAILDPSVVHPVTKEMEADAKKAAGMQLPAFSLMSSLDQTVTPASLKGRAFLFYFINLDCPCCMEANPSFRQLNQAFPGGVIGVADGPIEKVKRWVKANEPGYEVLADEKQVLAKAFKAINGVYSAQWAKSGKMDKLNPGFSKKEMAAMLAFLARENGAPVPDVKFDSAPDRSTSGCVFSWAQ